MTTGTTVALSFMSNHLLKSLRPKCGVAASLQADATCTNRQCEREATGRPAGAVRL